MLIYEYKLDGTKRQYAAIEEAIRVVQFIRNKCLRKWMDGHGISKNDLQCHCAVLAQEFSFAARLNSQARQASADRAWAAISRFYKNCCEKKPGKKGYPRFQHEVLDRDENAAKNILHAGLLILLLMAFAGIVGHTGTSSSEENASGQPAATRPSRKRKTSKRDG